jgi:hypothetical protein
MSPPPADGDLSGIAIMPEGRRLGLEAATRAMFLEGFE